jgi:ubiquinone/menaquinone biosynthesis C-methylase UbiE
MSAWMTPDEHPFHAMNPSPIRPESDVKTAYDRWADVYDSDHNPTRDLNALALRQQGFDLQGNAVLEVGCGTGLNTAWLAERADRIVAADFSRGMLVRAQQRVSAANVRFVIADVTEPWAFQERAFDLVLANLILEHVRDLDHVFGEACRVLRPGGRLYLGELHPYKQLVGSQARYQDAGSGSEVRVPAFVHTVAEFVNGAVCAGFVVERLDEWQAEGDTLPRLLTLLLRRTTTSG